jgi:hypothetical protein
LARARPGSVGIRDLGRLSSSGSQRLSSSRPVAVTVAVEKAAEPDRSVTVDHADEVVSQHDVAVAFGRLSAADREVLRLVAWERLPLRLRSYSANPGCR